MIFASLLAKVQEKLAMSSLLSGKSSDLGRGFQGCCMLGMARILRRRRGLKEVLGKLWRVAARLKLTNCLHRELMIMATLRHFFRRQSWAFDNRRDRVHIRLPVERCFHHFERAKGTHKSGDDWAYKDRDLELREKALTEVWKSSCRIL